MTRRHSADQLGELFGQQVRTYGVGRVCAHPGCGTVLSRYNPGGYCSRHERFHPDDPERMRYQGMTFAHCPVCDQVMEARHFDRGRHMCRRCARLAGDEVRSEVCPICGRAKKPSEVYYRPPRKDGSRVVRKCRDCENEYRRLNRQRSYSSIRERERRYYQEQKLRRDGARREGS